MICLFNKLQLIQISWFPTDKNACMRAKYTKEIYAIKRGNYLKRFASSIKGRFWHSVNSFHSAPSRFDISELCIFGLSWAIFRLWPRDQTINAFMGRFMWSDWDLINICDIFSNDCRSHAANNHNINGGFPQKDFLFQRLFVKLFELVLSQENRCLNSISIFWCI